LLGCCPTGSGESYLPYNDHLRYTSQVRLTGVSK
jgi:hypothetical protein